MTKLPFKTLPQDETCLVGDIIAGTLEIPKFYDLTANERIYIKQAGLVDLRKSAVVLAKRIAQSSGINTLDVYNALTTGSSEIIQEFLTEFLEFQELMEESQKRRTLVLATAIIKFRINPDWEIEDTQNSQLIKPLLVEAIADFAKQEEAGWQDVVEQEVEPDLDSTTPSPVSQIGEKSTGDAESTGRKKRDSRVSDLAPSQSG